jgi:hypothetical protein
MRILISYDQSYHVYSDTLERAISGLHPEVEVAACSLAEIGDQVESFDPHLVVSSRPNTVDPGGRAAWYRLVEGEFSEVPRHPSPMQQVVLCRVVRGGMSLIHKTLIIPVRIMATSQSMPSGAGRWSRTNFVMTEFSEVRGKPVIRSTRAAPLAPSHANRTLC